jgi:hypothetical protein
LCCKHPPFPPACCAILTLFYSKSSASPLAATCCVSGLYVSPPYAIRHPCSLTVCSELPRVDRHLLVASRNRLRIDPDRAAIRQQRRTSRRSLPSL